MGDPRVSSEPATPDARAEAEAAEDRDFYRWYGAWSPLAPGEVARLLEGMPD